MEGRRFDALARIEAEGTTRRGLLRLFSVVSLAGALATAFDEAEAQNGAGIGGGGRRRRRGARHDPGDDKQNRKGKRKGKDKGKNQKKVKPCLGGPCFRAPFTIEAQWTVEKDHDTYLFVPYETGNTGPSPYISMDCRPDNSNCETDVYPFACVDQDAWGPGPEVTTIRQFLAGVYEYWIKLAYQSAAGDVTVLLRNADGKVLRQWASPANPSGGNPLGWHVFDIDGATRQITSVDQVASEAGPLPARAHESSRNVCPR